MAYSTALCSNCHQDMPHSSSLTVGSVSSAIKSTARKPLDTSFHGELDEVKNSLTTAPNSVPCKEAHALNRQVEGVTRLYSGS